MRCVSSLVRQCSLAYGVICCSKCLKGNLFQIAMETGQSWLCSLGKTTSLTHSFIPTRRALRSALPLFCTVPGVGRGQEQRPSFPPAHCGKFCSCSAGDEQQNYPTLTRRRLSAQSYRAAPAPGWDFSRPLPFAMGGEAGCRRFAAVWEPA